MANTNIVELEEYLYQQMKERNETIDVESYQISIDKIGGIVSGILMIRRIFISLIRDIVMAIYKAAIVILLQMLIWHIVIPIMTMHFRTQRKKH